MVARAFFLLMLFLAAPGCDDGPNFQRLPVGTRCANDDDCGTTPYVCQSVNYPGGYCARACTTDGECPLDSICAGLLCRRKCVDDTTCRQTEGYVCHPTGASAPYCDIPTR